MCIYLNSSTAKKMTGHYFVYKSHVVYAEFLTELRSEATYFPTNEDLDGVVDALLRLQDTYALSVSQIASGDLHPGLEDTTVMSGELIRASSITQII